MDTHVLSVSTGRRMVTDLTQDVFAFCRGRGDGLCHVFAPHATAGIALVETGSGTEHDLAEAIERMLPTADVYVHRHGHLGHGRDHVLPAFVSPSMTLPVLDGRPQLGTWQSVVLVDPNADNPRRQVRLSFLAG